MICTRFQDHLHKTSGTFELKKWLYKVLGPLAQYFRNTWFERVVVQGFETTRTRFLEHLTWICGCTRFRDHLCNISGTLELNEWLYKVPGPLVQDFRNTWLELVGVQGFGTTYTRLQEHLSGCTRFRDHLHKTSGTLYLNLWLYKVSGPLKQDFRNTWLELVVVQGSGTTCTRFHKHLTWICGCTRFQDHLYKISGTHQLSDLLYKV